MNNKIIQQLEAESQLLPDYKRPNWPQIKRILGYYETGKYSYNQLSPLIGITPQRIGQIIQKYKHLMDKHE